MEMLKMPAMGMGRAIAASVLFSAVSLGSAVAQAEPAYDSEAIIKHFAENVDLGNTKGLCIGTVSECQSERQNAVAEAPFDLLVTFPLDSSELTPEAQANLDEFARALQDLRLRKFNFFVDGHTDAHGGDGYNLELSKRRANAVVGYLLRKGVPLEQLTPRGFGKERAVADDPYADVNRRVETSLSHMME